MSDAISKAFKLEQRLNIPKGTQCCEKANRVSVQETCQGLESLKKN